MLKHLLILIITLFLFNASSSAQVFLEKGVLFDDTQISVINIEIDQDSLDLLLAPGNEESNHEYPARFILSNSFGTDTTEYVGFRLRGNTSRDSDKKSFKISFNTFYGGRKYYGVEKINLNGEHNDPSIIRSKLSFDLFRNAGVPASRSNHVELYINNVYKGLYINVEHIDEEFVESRFGNKNGNLFKCLWPATLEYISNYPDDYKFTAGDRRAYELITNEEQDDYTDLAHFIDILNNTPSVNLHNELEPVFNVNSFLKYLALEILTGHWDAYSYNKNNFYLYHNQQTDKFEFIPYDLDNTYGIDWSGIDWAMRNIYNWAYDSDHRPLVNRILQNQVYNDRFSFFMAEIISDYFDPALIFPKIDDIKAMISVSAENDIYRTYDYGWSVQDFHDSYTQALGGHVTYGLKPYITTRFNSANSQLSVNSVSPIISHISFTELFIDRDLEIFITAEDEDPVLDVKAFYKVNSGSEIEVSLLDEGTGNDRLAGDHVYSVLIPAPLKDAGILELYVSATDTETNSSYEPINGVYTIIIPEPSDIELYINEIMASNSGIIFDNYRQYDDWVEIYNGGSTPVWLGDKYLSDDHYNPSKWQMPAVSMQAGEFMIFWADNDTEQGDYHTSFNLDAGGEEIVIYDSQEHYYAVIDHVTFGNQTTNKSIGRIPDGTGDIVDLAYSTPGWSNTTSLDVVQGISGNFKIAPNPFNDFIELTFGENQRKDISVQLYDLTGRLIIKQKYSQVAYQVILSDKLSGLAPGMYVIKVSGGNEFEQYQNFGSKLIVKK